MVFQFPVGPCADGAMGGVAGMEPHPLNGSLGTSNITQHTDKSPAVKSSILGEKQIILYIFTI